MKLTKAEDAYFLAGAIVAYNTKDVVYGNNIGDILGNGTIFAKVSYGVTSWHGYDGVSSGLGSELFIFYKQNERAFSATLTTKNLQQYKKDYDSYLDVRYATAEEIELLRKLAENDRIQFSHYKQSDTVRMLTNYLDEGIPPKPRINLDFREGKVSTPLDIDFYDMNKEKAEDLNSKYGLDISLDILSEIQNDKVTTIGDKPVLESEL